MQNIENIIKSRIQKNEAHTFVVVVPNESTRLIRQSELVSYHENNSVAKLQIFDIENFIQRLYSQVYPPRQTISRGIQHLWLHEIANPDDKSQYNSFRPVDDNNIPDSTLNLIAKSINNLRDRGESVNSVTSQDNLESDLINIYQEYENKLNTSWIDDRGKHLYLAKNFDRGYFKRAFPSTNLLVIEGFSILSKSDIEIFKRTARIPNLEVWFRTDCLESNTDLYTNIISLLSNFHEENVKIDSGFDRKSDEHQYLAENLFKSDSPLDNRRKLSKINVIRPKDRLEEVEQIAYQIRKHIDEDGFNLNDICVSFYNINHYQQRIAETFPAFGIPYTLSESIPLTKSTVIKEILSCLTPNISPMGLTYFSEDEITFPQSLQPDEFSEYIDAFLENSDIYNKIINPMITGNREIIEGEINALQHFKRIVTEFCDLFNTEDDISYPYRIFITKLQYIARQTYYQNRSIRNQQSVNILPVSELRSLEYKLVILGDFVDGGFPQNYNVDPLLSETPYHTRDEQIYDNRFLFYRLLKSYSEHLYLFIPKTDQEAELIPSLFLSYLQEIADFGEINIENPAERSVYGFLTSYGKSVFDIESSNNYDFPHSHTDLGTLIDHVARVEKSREKTNKHPSYEGKLTEKDLLANRTISQASLGRLKQYQDRIYSVTDLETYANCPYQYFVSILLKPKSQEDEENEELNPLDKGSLIHDVVAEFYTNRRIKKDPPISLCNDEDFDIAIDQINQIIENKQSILRVKDYESLQENNLYWTIDMDKIKVSLHKWLAAERQYELGVLPSYFEVGIGKTGDMVDQTLHSSEPITIGNVKMSGKIDRIDIGSQSFNIVDYKSGSSTPTINNINEGRALQVPIYLQLVKSILDETFEGEFNPTAGLYHKIRLDECNVVLGIGMSTYNGETYQVYNGKKWYSSGKNSGQLLDDDQFESTLDRVNGYVQQYVKDISNGIFPIITRVNTYVNSVDEGERPIRPKVPTTPCSYCNYLRICRVGAFTEKSDDES
ncbi:PD-(D/E)XK nuclease family protein [Candidatus Poribacteria bacterium]|nr:PD-(D/E)XK nuclease family protein [Candidatus Poribacteria bacterium]